MDPYAAILISQLHAGDVVEAAQQRGRARYYVKLKKPRRQEAPTARADTGPRTVTTVPIPVDEGTAPSDGAPWLTHWRIRIWPMGE